MQNPEIKGKVTNFIDGVTKNLNKADMEDSIKDATDKVKKVK